VAAGHPWVFGNEVEGGWAGTKPGDRVQVVDTRGRLLGYGYVNPRSLIAIRILSRKPSDFGPGFFAERLTAAEAYRKHFRAGVSAYRLCFGESDGLPGLVVDRYGDYLVLQSTTAGMDALLPAVVEGAKAALSPRAILLKCDSTVRSLEELEPRVEVASGSLPEEVEIAAEGSLFVVDLKRGQKTGFFLDQSDNRLRLAPWTKDRTVLDVFCYLGAWGLAALKYGARSVLGIDGSALAVGWAKASAQRSGVADRASFEEADAFDRLRSLHQEGKRFGVVVLDPPSFVKSKKTLAQGMTGYREINRRGFALVEPGGILATSSCSRHVDRDAFLGMLHAAADDAGRQAKIIAFGQQAADHPVLLRLPESDYLKCVFLEVT